MTVEPNMLVGGSVAIIACTVGLWFCILLIAFGDWKPNWWLLARRWGQCIICALVIATGSNSQTQPAWAQQQQAQKLENLERDVNKLSADVRLNTRDVGANSVRVDDHEKRMRQLEMAVTSGHTILIVLCFIAPALFQILLWLGQILLRRHWSWNGVSKP